LPSSVSLSTGFIVLKNKKFAQETTVLCPVSGKVIFQSIF
jgi:hypothetical protein